jgi:hypothetical protein
MTPARATSSAIVRAMCAVRQACVRALVAVGCSLATLPARGLPVAGGELSVTRSERAADCPDEEALSAATLALGNQPLEPSPDPLTANVALDRDEGGYVARIVTTGRKAGQREIRAPGETCAELVELTRVALAILFDLLPPEPSDPPPLAPVASQPAPAAPAAPKQLEKPRPSTVSSAKATERFSSVTAYGAVAYGLLGDAATGQVGGAFHLHVSRALEVGAGGFWAPGRTIPYEPGSVTVSLLAARLDLTAWLVSFGSLALAVRVDIGIGSLQGSGKGFDAEYTPAELWLAAGAGAVARLDLSRRWALRAAISGWIPYRSQTFSVQGVSGTAFESSPAALFVELGPELAFF